MLFKVVKGRNTAAQLASRTFVILRFGSSEKALAARNQLATLSQLSLSSGVNNRHLIVSANKSFTKKELVAIANGKLREKSNSTADYLERQSPSKLRSRKNTSLVLKNIRIQVYSSDQASLERLLEKFVADFKIQEGSKKLINFKDERDPGTGSTSQHRPSISVILKDPLKLLLTAEVRGEDPHAIRQRKLSRSITSYFSNLPDFKVKIFESFPPITVRQTSPVRSLKVRKQRNKKPKAIESKPIAVDSRADSAQQLRITRIQIAERAKVIAKAVLASTNQRPNLNQTLFKILETQDSGYFLTILGGRSDVHDEFRDRLRELCLVEHVISKRIQCNGNGALEATIIQLEENFTDQIKKAYDRQKIKRPEREKASVSVPTISLLPAHYMKIPVPLNPYQSKTKKKKTVEKSAERIKQTGVIYQIPKRCEDFIKDPSEIVRKVFYS